MGGGSRVGRGSEALRDSARLALVVFACLLLAITVVARWFDTVVLDGDGYLQAVGPLWREPAIREKAAEEITQRALRVLDTDPLVTELLPDVPDVIAGGVSAEIRAKLEPLVTPLARGGACLFVESDAFEEVWREANRSAHASAADQLLNPGNVDAQRVAVSIDVTDATRAVTALLLGTAEAEYLVHAVRPIEVELLDPGELALVRQVIPQLHARWTWVASAALIALLLAVALRRAAWLQTIAAAGFGAALMMIAVLLVLGWTESVLVARLEVRHVSAAATRAVYDALTSSLVRDIAWVGVTGAVAVLGTRVASVGVGRPQG